MEETPSLNMPVQRLKVAILPLDLPCSEPVIHSGEILTTGKSHGRDFWIRETGTVQQVAQIHDRYMIMMMMMMMNFVFYIPGDGYMFGRNM